MNSEETEKETQEIAEECPTKDFTPCIPIDQAEKQLRDCCAKVLPKTVPGYCIKYCTLQTTPDLVSGLKSLLKKFRNIL